MGMVYILDFSGLDGANLYHILGHRQATGCSAPTTDGFCSTFFRGVCAGTASSLPKILPEVVITSGEF